MPEDTAPLRLNKHPTTRAEISRSAVVIGLALVDALEYRSSCAICSNVQRRR